MVYLAEEKFKTLAQNNLTCIIQKSTHDGYGILEHILCTPILISFQDDGLNNMKFSLVKLYK